MSWDEPGTPALVVPVLEAEDVIGDLRRRYTESGAAGVPAHVTLIVPFTHASVLTPAREAAVAALLGRFTSFAFVLGRVERFETAGVAYLAPDPAEPFVAIIDALTEAFPEHPPYAGAHDTVIPHVTIAETIDPGVIDEVARTLQNRLPITAVAGRAVLVERDAGGSWTTRSSFPLGS